MFTAHKMLLEKSIGDLANMDTKRVISQLRSRGLLADYDLQVISRLSTASDKNIKIIDELKGRGPTAFDTFFQILSSIDTTSAEKLLPVQHRILWFTSSPRYAAAVTYILEKYFNDQNTLLLKTEGQKPHGSYLLRRGRIFKRRIPSKILNSDADENCEIVRMAQDAEFYLAFPISERGDTPQNALREVFQELGSKVTVAILSGVCKGVRGDSGRPEELDVRGGDVVLATEAVSVEGRKRELPLSSALMEAKTYLFELPEKKQDWFEEAKKKLRELEQADIIPVPRFVPHFDTIRQDATPTETGLPRALASDPDTFPFYDLCTQHLGVEQPWFSCKGVISHTMLNNVDPSQDPDSICALMSTFFAAEACKAIVNKLRQSSQTFNTRAE